MTNVAPAQLRAKLHLAAIQNPSGWLIQAVGLRDAARQLDWIHFNPETGHRPGFLLEYRLLMALSIENLIKGILVTHRLRAGDPKPLVGIFTHKLAVLGKQLPSDSVTLSQRDIALLEDLTPYIEWAGRYPFPKDSTEHVAARGHGSTQHDWELDLWSRLCSHLKDIGWCSKGIEGEEGWFFLLTRGSA